MRKYKLLSLIIAIFFSLSANAFSTDDERIDSYLNILSSTGSDSQKIRMLERLQWSGISDERLFDPIENMLLKHVDKHKPVTGDQRKLMAYQLRSLGYSGNEKYKETLELFRAGAAAGSLSRYAKKSLDNLADYARWNKLVANSQIDTTGKSSEVASYMRMLDVNSVYTKRLAARAIFHERQTDADLIALAAEKLKAMYLDKGLSKEGQDSAAWLTKAIGQTNISEYSALLQEVAENSPHGKIKKYARKFAI